MSEESVTPQPTPEKISGDVDIYKTTNAEQLMKQIIHECGLKEGDIHRLRENEIDGKNILFVTADDLKTIGLGIGPARQIQALVSSLKKQKVNPKAQLISVKMNKTKQEPFVNREEQRVFEELRQVAKMPREPVVQ